MEISDSRIDAGKAFDWGRTSEDYARFRDIYPELSMHDFRMVRGSKRTKLVFDLAVPYTMGSRHAQIKEQIDDALLHRGKPYRTVIRFDAKA
jgi:hypothetical protein